MSSGWSDGLVSLRASPWRIRSDLARRHRAGPCLDPDPDPDPDPDLDYDTHHDLHHVACLTVPWGKPYKMERRVLEKRPGKSDYPALLLRLRYPQYWSDMLVDLV